MCYKTYNFYVIYDRRKRKWWTWRSECGVLRRILKEPKRDYNRRPLNSKKLLKRPTRVSGENLIHTIYIFWSADSSRPSHAGLCRVYIGLHCRPINARCTRSRHFAVGTCAGLVSNKFELHDRAEARAAATGAAGAAATGAAAAALCRGSRAVSAATVSQFPGAPNLHQLLHSLTFQFLLLLDSTQFRRLHNHDNFRPSYTHWCLYTEHQQITRNRPKGLIILFRC